MAERHESKIDETVNMGMQIVKEYLPDDDRLMTLNVGPQHPGKAKTQSESGRHELPAHEHGNLSLEG